MAHIDKILIFVVLVCFTSCNTIYEDNSPCRVTFDFVYDKNMLYTDAFRSQCDHVELFIFNQDSIFLQSIKKEGKALQQANYRMEIPLEKGTYTAFAWVGRQNSYLLTDLKAGISKIKDLQLMLKTESNKKQNKKIEDLWHAAPVTFSFNGETNRNYTLQLTRNTNTIHLVVKTMNFQENCEAEFFNISLSADNSNYRFDNHIIKKEEINYIPYYLSQEKDFFTAELNTMRLIEGDKINLKIETKDGKSIFGKKTSIDLIKYLLMTKMDKYSTMSNQEYLDRQYDWNVVLFYNNQNSLVAQIIINDWVIRFNDTDFN